MFIGTWLSILYGLIFFFKYCKNFKLSQSFLIVRIYCDTEKWSMIHIWNKEPKTNYCCSWSSFLCSGSNSILLNLVSLIYFEEVFLPFQILSKDSKINYRSWRYFHCSSSLLLLIFVIIYRVVGLIIWN